MLRAVSRFLSSDRDYYQHASVDNMPYRWMALEAMTNGKHSKASDVWSLAVLMWEASFAVHHLMVSGVAMLTVLLDVSWSSTTVHEQQHDGGGAGLPAPGPAPGVYQQTMSNIIAAVWEWTILVLLSG